MDKVRCPSCRGSKKVAKLGGVIGECNTCSGEGKILAVDKPNPMVAEVVEPVCNIVSAVAQAVPSRTDDDIAVIADAGNIKPIEAQEKIDRKKAVFKRKRA